jgi:NAD(P)-dependent dehydrogenase (short-subunit alcohol dehydrogenase family)
MRNPMELTGRTIIVTGAGQGIGRAITELVLDLGGNAVLVERNPETLAATAAEMDADRILAVQGNVAEEGFSESCVAQAVDRFGAVHGLVNNAGITRPAMIEKMTFQQWQAVIDVNLTGCYLMLQSVGRHMCNRARAELPQPTGTTGAIVNISSTAGKHRPDQLLGRQGRAVRHDHDGSAGMGALRRAGEQRGLRHGGDADDRGDPQRQVPRADHVPHPARPGRAAGRGGTADLLPAVERRGLHQRREHDGQRRQPHAALRP